MYTTLFALTLDHAHMKENQEMQAGRIIGRYILYRVTLDHAHMKEMQAGRIIGR